MSRWLFVILAVLGAALVNAQAPDPVPAPSQPVVIQDPLPLPVHVDEFPGTQDVNVVSPNPLPVDIGSGNEVDVGNFPAVQDVRVVNTESITVNLDSSNGRRDTIYMLSVHAISDFPPEQLTVPFDSRVEGVVIATSGSTQLGNCRTRLAYESSSDAPEGSNTRKIVEVLSPTTNEIGSSSIHVPVPGLFIPGGTRLIASISDTGPSPDNTCGSELILYLRDQRPTVGQGG